MNFKPLAIALAVAAFLCPSLSAHAEATKQTLEFVHKASEANMFEIESSNLALKKTSAKDVKELAQMMVADHTQIGDQLEKVLQTSETGLKPVTALDTEHQETFDSLKAASAPTFDNMYVQAQAKAHDEAVKLFSEYAEGGDNATLKKLASDTLPQLKKHQEMVHKLSQSYVSAGK